MTPRSRRFSVLLLALAALALLAASPAGAPGPHAVSVQGEVEVGRGEPPVFRPLVEGAPLLPGDRIRTGPDGRAELALGRGVVRLFESSLLRLPEELAAGSIRLGLDEGRSLFDVLRRSEHELFEVETPEAVVSVKGTRFAVARVGGTVGVSVFRGAVHVAGVAAPADLLLEPGDVALGSAGRSFELRHEALVDPWDDFHRGGSAPLLRHLPPPAAPAPQAAAPRPAAPALAKTGPARVAPGPHPGPDGVTARIHPRRPVRVDVLAAVRERPELVQDALLGARPGGPMQPPGGPGVLGHHPKPGALPGAGGGTATAPAMPAHPPLRAILRHSGILQGLTPEMRDELRSQLEQVENLQELQQLLQDAGIQGG